MGENLSVFTLTTMYQSTSFFEKAFKWILNTRYSILLDDLELTLTCFN